MDQGKIAVLKAEVDEQIKVIQQIYIKIDKRSDMNENDPAKIESMSYQLHNLYCAFEDSFKIVLNYFENNIVEIESYHAELLKKMKLNLGENKAG